MELQPKSMPTARRWAQNTYLILAGLILLGIFTQGFLIGASLFGGAPWGRTGHGLLALVLLLFTLLLPIMSLLAQLPGIIKGVSLLLFVLMIVQFILPSLGSNAPLISALHPANATLLFGMEVFLISRTLQFMRSR